MNNDNQVLYQILEEIKDIKKGQKSDRELLEITVDQVGKLTNDMQDGFKDVRAEIKDVRAEIKELKGEVLKTNMTIEHDVMTKIDALFDGYKQNTESVKRIEEKVSAHEEFIITRIK